MQTIVLNQPGELALTQTDRPGQPEPGQAQVRVHRVGICGTDLHAYRGSQPFFSYPRVLGHELGVTVEAVGQGVTNVRVGDRCSVEPYLHCGRCGACKRGHINCCENLQVLGVHTDGGMRESFCVRADKLHSSQTLSLDQLALVETLGIGAHAVARCAIQGQENVLVVGAGPIGLAAAQFARAAGGRVVVMDLNQDRLRFVREQAGFDRTVVADDQADKQLRERFSGDLPTAVLDATGNRPSMQVCFDRVASGGRLTFVGLFPGDVTFHDPDFHRRELTLLASRNSLPSDFKRIIAMLEAGQIDTTPWISHRASASQIIDHFPYWLDPGCGVTKAMVEFA